MVDLRFIKENLEAVKENTLKRKSTADPEEVVRLYDERNRLLASLESLRRRRNENSAAMNKKLNDSDRRSLIDEGRELKQRIAEFEKKIKPLEERLFAQAHQIPNMTHPDSPEGEGEEENREIKRWGEIVERDYVPRNHLEIAHELDLIDFDSAAKVSGPKFYYLKNEAVLLEMALLKYAADILRKEYFTLTITPDIAKEEVADGIGFVPRGDESNIYTLEGTGTCLIGTSEITLGGYHMDDVLDTALLPIKIAGLSHCFRREAGAAGQYSKGLYRVHQFTKLEMFVYSHPDRSDEMLEYLLGIEEKIFQGLVIPYRVVDICSGELGGPAYRKYDIEAWMPGRDESGGWGEITSASNCTDYQARRLRIRFKENGKNMFVHMLNGTAVAIPRTLVAILENYQQKDGSVSVPEALVPYMGGKRKIKNQ